MHWKKLVALCALSLSAAVFAPPAAHAAAPTVMKLPLVLTSSAQSDIELCVGETVTVTDGQFNVVYKPGALFHRNIAGGRAIGDETGRAYRLSGHIQEVDHFIGADGETYTFVLQLNAATSGGASFSAKGLFHLTVAPSGNLVAYSDHFAITKCG